MIAQLKGAVSELWIPFVDDGLLAGLILAWIVLALLVVRTHTGTINLGLVPVLFPAGLLAILAASVVRAAWRARSKRRASADG
jgi:hypothetical protein